MMTIEREFPLITTGVVKYDPVRERMKGGKYEHKGNPRADTKFRDQWWCVIELDEGIGYLYRWFLDRHWYDADRSPIKRNMARPGWGMHISVVRGERPRPEFRDRWGYRDGEKVEVRYSPVIRQTGDTTGYDREDNFFFLEAHCDAFLDIRKNLGLDWKRNGKEFRSHISIARVFE